MSGYPQVNYQASPPPYTGYGAPPPAGTVVYQTIQPTTVHYSTSAPLVQPPPAQVTVMSTQFSSFKGPCSGFLNFLWIVFGGGFFMMLMWAIMGLVMCATIIGIPVGIQFFKLANLSLLPFGRRIDRSDSGCGSLFLNILWFPFGLCVAMMHVMFGVMLCCTLIGIPFGIQHFKLSFLAFAPCGAEVSDGEVTTNVTTVRHV